MIKNLQSKLKILNNRIDVLKKELSTVKGTLCEVYTRIVGYYRSVPNWNPGKREEFKHRITFKQPVLEVKKE